MNLQKMARVLYRMLLSLYPQTFKDQLAESMEQTFRDAYNEHKSQGARGLFKFVSWAFIETATGILREHLFLISSGGIMKTLFKTAGSSTLTSLLLILPFVIMEIVNRRQFNEDFPYALFFIMWINLFAVILILSPIVRSKRVGKVDATNSSPAQRNALFTKPKSALIASVVLILIIVIPLLIFSLGQESAATSNTEYFYAYGVQVPSQLIALVFFLIPIIAGYIAGMPIVKTVQSGGSLFAHPLHLIIVVVISFLFAAGFASLVVDQWSCFIGVPLCD